MEKRKYSITISLLLFCYIGFSQDIQPFEFRYETYVSEIKTDSTIVNVSAYYFTPERKFRADKKYFWLAQDSIIETHANYSGKLLHGDYEEFYKNGQLKTKGEFKNGLKVGKWFFWNLNGEIEKIEKWRHGKMKVPKKINK